jgi:methyl-accepting chemotaxis protein
MKLLNLNHLRFSVKLPLIISTAALLTGGIVGYGAVNMLTERANEAAEAQFEFATHARATQLKNYLESIVGNLHALTDNPTSFDAMQAFQREWAALGSSQTERLQQAYLHDNPNPVGKKNEMMAASDGSGYSAIHTKYHPWLNEFLSEMGLYDVFFIAPNGDVIYTVYKEPDFASNVKNGSTALGSLFNRAMELPAGSEAVIYEDFKPYSPKQ